MSNATWMADMHTEIGELTLRQLLFPGTHDSGTCDIKSTSGYAPDGSLLLNGLYGLGLRGLVISEITANWAKAQGTTIRQQLDAGIRYLDFRVCTGPGGLSICHTLYSTGMESVVAQVKAFVEANPKEIVLLDISHFYGLNDGDHDRFIKSLKEAFGKALVPQGATTSAKVKDLWEAGTRVIVFYAHEKMVEKHSELWPQGSISSPWVNKQKVSDLYTELKKELARAPQDKFFGLQGILTPNGGMIAAGLVPFTSDPGSLEALGRQVSPAVVGWVKEEWCDDPGLNVVLVDWAESVALTDVLKTILSRRYNQPGSRWIRNDDWNDHYVGSLKDYYLDTNEVLCPEGKRVVGFGLYKKGGNRIAPTILCADADGGGGEWVKNEEWNGEYVGPLKDFFVDTNEILCPKGEVATGFTFYKKGGNRIAPRIRIRYGAGAGWVENDYWNENYVGTMEGMYADVNSLACASGTAAVGFSLRQKGGNRLAPKLLAGQ